MSITTDIADAVTAELNSAPGGTFSQAFTAQRRVLPVYELEQLAELRVTVVPKAVAITGSTRAASQYEFTIDIGVQRKLLTGAGDADTEVDTLGSLVDQIAAYLRQRPLTGAPWVSWVSMTNDPVYAPEHLHEQRVFTSVLSVTYRALGQEATP
ncbi:MAG: hypothetical protein GVY24_06040 [Planctomycetes bacterium]|jgi:hypothetical protein|nr:hypothetical protein [Planctomycetota bacterium]